jgi:hypothetical protein
MKSLFTFTPIILTLTLLLFPFISRSQIIDATVDVKSETFQISIYPENNQAQYRVILENIDTKQVISGNWQHASKLDIQGRLGESYIMILEAKNDMSGTSSEFEVGPVSIANLLKTRARRKSTASVSAQSNENWDISVSAKSDSFPRIELTADVAFGGLKFSGDPDQLALLDASNFSLLEDGRFESVDRVIQPDPSAALKAVDIIFVHDDSGSLEDEAAQVKANINNFIGQLQTENFDFRIALVPYGGNGFSSPGGTILNNGSLTNNVADFQSDIDLMRFDGRTERAYDAISLAISNSLWRGNTQKVIILVTDEPNNSGSIDETEIIQTINNNNVLFYGLTAGTSDFNRVATAVNGRIFNVNEPFDAILQEIGLDLSSRYSVQFNTDNTTFGSVQRSADFTVNASDRDGALIEASVTVQYTPQLPIEVSLSNATKAALSLGQLPDRNIPILASVTSEIPISDVTLFYKSTVDSAYTTLGFTQNADSSWGTTIPAAFVTKEGVSFYILVDTAVGRKTLPADDPEINPLNIAVLPNIPPSITHIPVTTGFEGIPIDIFAEVEDASREVTNVALFYREVGSSIYSQIEISFDTSQVNFNQQIPSEFVTSNGVEYFVVAEDNFGTKSQVGSEINPLVISVTASGLPAGCNTFGTVEVCADVFSVENSNNVITASGRVQLGNSSGQPVVAFSGALNINTLTNRISSLGIGNLSALDMITWFDEPRAIPIARIAFDIDGNQITPELQPVFVFDYMLNTISLTASNIILNERSIELISVFSFPLLSDFANVVAGALDSPILFALDQVVLSQLPNESSLNIDFDFSDISLERRKSRFGKGGMSFTFNSLEFDFLHGSTGLSGSMNVSQKSYNLSGNVGFSPLRINSIGFAYKNKNILAAYKIPIAATGFSIAQNKFAFTWQPGELNGSISGVLVDPATALYRLGKVLNREILGVNLAANVSNRALTWGLSGTITMLEDFDLARADVTAGLLGNGIVGVDIYASIGINDILNGQVRVSAQTSSQFTQLTGSVEAKIQVPEFVPIWGGQQLSGLRGDTLFKVDHADDDKITAYSSFYYRVLFKDVGLTIDYSDPRNIEFNRHTSERGVAKSVKRAKGLSSLNQSQEFSVTVGDNERLIFINASASNGLPALTLKTPSGLTVDASNVRVDVNDLGDETNPIVAIDNQNSQTTFILADPAAGVYKVNVLNSDTLSDLTIESSVPAPVPSLTITEVDADAKVGEMLNVAFELENLLSISQVEIALRTTSEPLVEISISTLALGNELHSLSIPLPDNLVPDDYKLVIKAKNDNQARVSETSLTNISISDNNGLTLPSNIVTEFGNGEATITWDGSNFSADDVLIIKVVNETTNTSFVSVANVTVNQLPVSPLINSHTYTLYASLYNDIGQRSNYINVGSGSPTGGAQIGSPDLFFTDNTILESDTKSRGEPISIVGSIFNNSIYPAFSSRFNCYFDSISEENLVSTQLLPIIEPQSELAVSCDIDQAKFNANGQSIFGIIADVTLEERNKANNGVVIANVYMRNVEPEVADMNMTTNEDISITIDVIAGADDLNGDALSIEEIEQPVNGVLTVEGNNLRYLPNADYFGNDSFTYTLSDGDLVSSFATVSIDVTPVNDPPELIAVDTIEISESAELPLQIMLTDVDNTELSSTWTVSGEEITLKDIALDNLNLESQYVTEDMTLSLTVEVSDGELTTSKVIQVTVLNDNAIPTVTLSGPSSVVTRGQIALTASAQDDNIDSVGISWQQVSGPSVTIPNTADTSISFTAPTVTSAQTIVIQVNAADPEHNVSDTISINITPAPEQSNNSSGGGGTMNAFYLVLMAIIVLRRYKECLSIGKIKRHFS